MKLYRGRIFDHVGIKVRDLKRSRDFYKAIFESLGHQLTQESDSYFFIDELKVIECKRSSTQSVHLAFQAENPASVNLFYETGIKFGGICNGAPSERKIHQNYYSAYLLDPDGNSIEAVYHGPYSRSAHCVEVDYPGLDQFHHFKLNQSVLFHSPSDTKTDFRIAMNGAHIHGENF